MLFLVMVRGPEGLQRSLQINYVPTSMCRLPICAAVFLAAALSITHATVSGLSNLGCIGTTFTRCRPLRALLLGMGMHV